MVLPSAVSTLLCVRRRRRIGGYQLSRARGAGGPLVPPAAASTRSLPRPPPPLTYIQTQSTLTSTSNFISSVHLQCTQDVKCIVLSRSLCAATNSYILDWTTLGRLGLRFPLLSLYCPNLLMMGGSVATFSSLSSNNAGGISM